MKSRAFPVFLFFGCLAATAFGQKLRKDERRVVADLQASVRSLQKEPNNQELVKAALEGFQLKPLGEKGSWYQTFERLEGKTVRAARLAINDNDLTLREEFFPLSFSASKTVEGDPAVALQEGGEPWFVDLKEFYEPSENGVTGVSTARLRDRARQCVAKGATAVLFYNSTKRPDSVRFDDHDTTKPEPVPVLFVTGKGRKKYLTDEAMSMDMDISVDISDRRRHVSNVIGYLNNGGQNVTVVCAHQTDSNSLCAVASLLELVRKLRETKGLRSNYLFVTLAGERPDSSGLTHFLVQPPVPAGRITSVVCVDRFGKGAGETRVAMEKNGVPLVGFAPENAPAETDYVAAARCVKAAYALLRELDGHDRAALPQNR